MAAKASKRQGKRRTKNQKPGLKQPWLEQTFEEYWRDRQEEQRKRRAKKH